MSNIEKATFGGGCFWGVEELFTRIEGVKDAVSGYMGGNIQSPTYEQVCTGRTGHAEVVEVSFDSSQISYKELLDYFFRMHDPTTPNQQGVDIGNQYRSVIFFHNEEQKKEAQEFIDLVESKEIFDRKVVTEISKACEFWPAEDYHQDYYQKKYQGGVGPICHRMRDESFLGES
ncbi:MAG: peptide-methionine (S)-S-oxide reductase MsrA [Bacteriovoracaceae bacterium]|nr:peptide-methionine (S)-S-oxide reductase MsrA [Bacteriovoracaceae bacterium]